MIGFGSTEANYEEHVESLLWAKARELRAQSDCSYGFSDEVIAKLKSFADGIAVESRHVSDSYKTAENYPDRYSDFHAYVLGDCNYIAVILSFMHINRRHAFSPDGWASMQNKRTVVIDEWEANRYNRENKQKYHAYPLNAQQR